MMTPTLLSSNYQNSRKSIGLDSLERVLIVVYTYRGSNIRLISARRATRKQRQNYESGI
jgi:uncharacterized DUF497 family protein